MMMTRQRWTAPVPPMTHELSSAWVQPDPNVWAFDDTHVVMPESDFKALHEYSHSYPTGRYEGKMWKARTSHGEWYLMWYGDGLRDLAPIQVRRVLLV